MKSLHISQHLSKFLSPQAQKTVKVPQKKTKKRWNGLDKNIKHNPITYFVDTYTRKERAALDSYFLFCLLFPGNAFPSQDLIASRSGCSASTAKRALAQATKDGVLKTTARFNDSNLYYIDSFFLKKEVVKKLLRMFPSLYKIYEQRYAPMNDLLQENDLLSNEYILNKSISVTTWKNYRPFFNVNLIMKGSIMNEIDFDQPNHDQKPKEIPKMGKSEPYSSYRKSDYAPTVIHTDKPHLNGINRYQIYKIPKQQPKNIIEEADKLDTATQTESSEKFMKLVGFDSGSSYLGRVMKNIMKL